MTVVAAIAENREVTVSVVIEVTNAVHPVNYIIFTAGKIQDHIRLAGHGFSPKMNVDRFCKTDDDIIPTVTIYIIDDGTFTTCRKILPDNIGNRIRFCTAKENI